MTKLTLCSVMGAVLLATSIPQTVMAADSRCSSKVKSCVVMSGCEKSKSSSNYCGAIVYINKGGYVTRPVKLQSRSSQPIKQPVLMNAAQIQAAADATKVPKVYSDCRDISEKIDTDVSLGKAVQFIAPGECAYKLDINIKAGNKKDRNLFLVPGCVIEMSTDGTTNSNDWSQKVYWSSQAKKAGASGKVQDPLGNKCGRQSKM